MSFAISFGRPAWPRINYGTGYVRFVFGPVAVWLMAFDFDLLLGAIKKEK